MNGRQQLGQGPGTRPQRLRDEREDMDAPAHVTATYTITLADVLAGQVVNQATATGAYTDATNTPQTATDLSDNNTNPENDSTVVPAQVATTFVSSTHAGVTLVPAQVAAVTGGLAWIAHQIIIQTRP